MRAGFLEQSELEGVRIAYALVSVTKWSVNLLLALFQVGGKKLKEDSLVDLQ